MSMRAFHIIEKSNLDPQDKQFLRIHIETLSEVNQALESHILELQDIIDHGQYLNFKVNQAKEILATLCDDKEAVKQILERFKEMR